jgi:hypothetical protein
MRATSRRGDKQSFDRLTFTVSRAMEYLTDKELSMQIGRPREWWPIAVAKEIIDNGLDAAEMRAASPAIKVVVDDSSMGIHDNGTGIPLHVLDGSFDYTVRVSDKSLYVSPTRGQLGNGLKCVYSAPFVASGEDSYVEVSAHGQKHTIRVVLDRLAHQVNVGRTGTEPSFVKNGTLFKVHWPEVASYLRGENPPDFYNGKGCDPEWCDDIEDGRPSILELIKAYGLFNPHASFTLSGQAGAIRIDATNRKLEKWMPDYPSCPHWYTAERLRDLIAAIVVMERHGAKPMTLRGFLATFSGLQSTIKQRDVAMAASLHGAYLADLVSDDKIDLAVVERLLREMKKATRRVKSKALGVLGGGHVTQRLIADYGVAPDSIRYRQLLGKEDEGTPYVLEVAFGVRTNSAEEGRKIVCGVNWSPTLGTPFAELDELLGEMRIDYFDPVVLSVHLAIPHAGFTDRGKCRLAVPLAVRDALGKAMRYVATPWKKEKRQADANDRLTVRALEQLKKANQPKVLDRKTAAWKVLPEAFLHVVDNDLSNPAKARQIMYAVRKRMLPLTGDKFWKHSSTFTQKVLPEFMEAHSDLTRDWDVVWDSRGHLTEAHTNTRIELGTLGVRGYQESWLLDFPEFPEAPRMPLLCPTKGPINRYKFVLFCEKEGFDEHFKKARISELYDIPIMSTKGMSVTAVRQLAEKWAELGVTILVLHDFDKSGFSILYTLQHDSPRYKFRKKPLVKDIGLRLEHVREYGLDGETVLYKRAKVDPRQNLRRNGATPEECDFLVSRTKPPYIGKRCELNELTTPDLIRLVKRGLEAAGVKKVIPDEETLKKAYLLAWRKRKIQEAADRTAQRVNKTFTVTPTGLEEKVRGMIEGTTKSWDEAIAELARKP